MNKTYSDLTAILTDPDIHYVKNPEGVSLKIEEIKNLQKEMVYKPFDNFSQVGIIFDAHMLTTEAQNALLKTLEEQNENTHYFLLTANARDLLPTILSRGKKYYPNTNDYIDTLEETLNSEIDPISSQIELLDNDIVKAFLYIEQLVEQEKEQKGVIESSLQIIELAIEQDLQRSIESNQKEQVEKQLKNLEIIITAKKRLHANVNKRLLLENVVMQLNGNQ